MTPNPDEIISQLRERCSALTSEVSELRSQLNGDTEGSLRCLQSRAARQRVALDRLNRKVLSQRFRLRHIAALGRDLTMDEYELLRKSEPYADRLDDYAVVG